MKEDDFRQVAAFIDEGIELSIEAKKRTGRVTVCGVMVTINEVCAMHVEVKLLYSGKVWGKFTRFKHLAKKVL